MLTHLHIQNYALISHLDIDFEEGFSVMTGETGSGKSIILGALGLVLGGRADSKTITDGEDKCIIEAVFQNPTSNLFYDRPLDARSSKALHPTRGGEKVGTAAVRSNRRSRSNSGALKQR